MSQFSTWQEVSLPLAPTPSPLPAATTSAKPQLPPCLLTSNQALIAKTDQPYSPHTPLKLTHTGLQPSHNLTIFLRPRMHPPDLLRDSLYSPKIYFKAARNC